LSPLLIFHEPGAAKDGRMKYSEGFKAKMVARMVGPDGMSARALAADAGVSAATLYRWQRDSLRDMTDEAKGGEETVTRTPGPRTAVEKALLVVQASRLTDVELGTFLRRNGVFESELDEWRAALEDAFHPRDGKLDKQREAANRKRIKGLERELRTKEKALAEAAALLVLQKKVRALWGAEDDDTEESSGD
jgi:transposase-like protein